LAKVTCGEFLAAFAGACALTLVAATISKTRAINAANREATGSDFRKDVIALPPRPQPSIFQPCRFLSETTIGQQYSIQFTT
jgi:hypothetical protein